jgi:histidyl-tRNA synthetase
MPQSRGFARLPGFRDFPPEDLALRSHIFEAWRRVSKRYGYLEYDAPPLEALELYAEKSGEELVGQLYEFTDKGDRRIALRPEMTPSLARILAERSKAMPKPIRWFAIPQLFRYERQQRGRLREHYQWNVDLVGEGGIEADAEVLAVALDGLVELGLTATDVRARVSDRILLGAVLAALGVPAERERAAFGVIDKIERESRERVAAKLTGPEVGLDAASAARLLALFEGLGIEKVEAGLGSVPAVASRLADLRRFIQVMDDLGFGEFVEIDLSVVRGLAYYTGIVFEVFDREGEFRAICGGGRYDRLLELVGGDPLPAVGFGMGDVVLGELLRNRAKVPEYRPQVDFYIVTVGPEQSSVARRIAAAQRRSGRSVVHAVSAQSMKRQFSSAASVGARAAIILGPDEVARGIAVVKDMGSGEQSEMPLERLTNVSNADPGRVPDRVQATS